MGSFLVQLEFWQEPLRRKIRLAKYTTLSKESCKLLPENQSKKRLWIVMRFSFSFTQPNCPRKEKIINLRSFLNWEFLEQRIQVGLRFCWLRGNWYVVFCFCLFFPTYFMRERRVFFFLPCLGKKESSRKSSITVVCIPFCLETSPNS